jgi:hypothetical protein
MSDEIAVRFDIRDYNEPAINARMQHRATSPLKSASFFLIPFGAALGVGAGAAALMGLPADVGFMVASYAGLGSFFAALVMGLRHRGQLAAVMRASPLRALPYEVVLSAQGVVRSGRHYPWSVFTGVAVLPGLTVLQFSTVEGVIVPDKELPNGMTAQAARTQINQWRKDAA